MKWNGQSDGRQQHNAKERCTDPWNEPIHSTGHVEQQPESRDSFDRHRRPNHPGGTSLVFDCNVHRAFRADDGKQRIVDQLHEPDDTGHHGRSSQVEDENEHVSTIERIRLLWLTGVMTGEESHEHVHSYGKDVQAALTPITRELRELIPDVYKGFGGLHAAAFRDGALDAKTKELVALAIAITTHCDGCIAAHARGAARTGATEQEVAELIGVTISMNGGPGTVYGPRAFAAFREFKNS